ncbi:hypothetical protein ACF1B0_21740 [Streptomyces anandii]
MSRYCDRAAGGANFVSVAVGIAVTETPLCGFARSRTGEPGDF